MSQKVYFSGQKIRKGIPFRIFCPEKYTFWDKIAALSQQQLDVLDYTEHVRYVVGTKTAYRFLLFRVVEVQRTCEATATPTTEGASLSEIYDTDPARPEDIISNNKRSPIQESAYCGLSFWKRAGAKTKVF